MKNNPTPPATFPPEGTYDVLQTSLPHSVRTNDIVIADTETGFAHVKVLSKGREVRLTTATASQYAKRPLSMRLHSKHSFSPGKVMTKKSGEMFIARKLLSATVRSAGLTSRYLTAHGPRLADEAAAERARKQHGPTMRLRLLKLVGKLAYDTPVPEGSEVIWRDQGTRGYEDVWYTTPDSTVWITRTEYDWPRRSGPTTATRTQVEHVAKLMLAHTG